jgi:hypothetical protein
MMTQKLDASLVEDIKALSYLNSCFADIDSRGVDYLLLQRPDTACAEMNGDQFRQYALAVIGSLTEALAKSS